MSKFIPTVKYDVVVAGGGVAGVAAALAAKNSVTVDEVPYETVAENLVQRGVKLHLSDVGLKYRQ